MEKHQRCWPDLTPLLGWVAAPSLCGPEGWLKRSEGEVEAERVHWFVSDFRKALIESLPTQEE